MLPTTLKAIKAILKTDSSLTAGDNTEIIKAIFRHKIPKDVKSVIEHLIRREKTQFTQRDIHHSLFQSAEQTKRAIEWLLNHDYCRKHPSQTKYQGMGRPKGIDYEVNPHLFNSLTISIPPFTP